MIGERLSWILAAATFVALALGCLFGPGPLTTAQALAALVGQGQSEDLFVVWQIRLPRALAAFVVGAALGASGAALQGLLRNPLAEPGVLGVSASAVLGATATIYYGLASAWALPLAAIASAVLATALLAFAALRSASVVTLILIGVGLSSFAGALTSLLFNLAPHPLSLAELINWTLGSVANRSYDDLALIAPFVAIGLMLLFVSRRGLSALTLGEEAASGVGLDLPRQRIVVVIGSGLAAGAAVALAGAIGFVGIVAPHLVRPLVAHDPARCLLPAALLAGLLLMLADLGVRLLPSAHELKLGVVAALIGAPAFVWIAVQRRSLHG